MRPKKNFQEDNTIVYRALRNKLSFENFMTLYPPLFHSYNGTIVIYAFVVDICTFMPINHVLSHPTQTTRTCCARMPRFVSTAGNDVSTGLIHLS